MRVAILSDLRSNPFALEAILEDIARQGVNQKSDLRKHNIHLPLSNVESSLQKPESQRIYEQLKAYAQEMGGTEADIDPVLQASNWDGFSRETWDVIR